MRTSIAFIALITTPVLLVACASTPDEPVRGTVIEKEYEPGKSCPNTTSKKRKVSRPCTPKKECYELDILLDYSGSIVEVCDKAAYMVLDVEHNNRYSSDIDYNREEH